MCLCQGEGAVSWEKGFSLHSPSDKGETQKQVVNSLNPLLLCGTIEVLSSREAAAAAWCWRERDAKL